MLQQAQKYNTPVNPDGKGLLKAAEPLIVQGITFSVCEYLTGGAGTPLCAAASGAAGGFIQGHNDCHGNARCLITDVAVGTVAAAGPAVVTKLAGGGGANALEQQLTRDVETGTADELSSSQYLRQHADDGIFTAEANGTRLAMSTSPGPRVTA